MSAATYGISRIPHPRGDTLSLAGFAKLPAVAGDDWTATSTIRTPAGAIATGPFAASLEALAVPFEDYTHSILVEVAAGVVAGFGIGAHRSDIRYASAGSGLVAHSPLYIIDIFEPQT